MGFPNAGADATLQRIRKNRSKIRVPLFVNIGKNRDTPNEKAYEDYRHCLRVLDEIADAFVINISSPNTKGLRELLLPENFRTFVKNIFRDKVSSKPWLLKLSPDLEPSDLQNVLATACEVGCNGFILTNTKANEQRYFPHREGGGVSGGPLKPFSEEFLLQTSEYLTKHSIRDKLIVSVGGIESAEDVMKRLQNGADLVQVYSALIFEGPGFFRRTIKELNWQSGEKSDPTGYL